MNVFNNVKVVIMLLSIAFASSFGYYARVDANTLNVRESPSTKSKVVYKLKKGDVINTNTCINDFCRINYGSAIGYVSKDYIVPIENVLYTVDEPQKKIDVSDSDNVGFAWKAGVLVFWLIAIIAAVVGFRKKNVIVGVVGSTISVLFLLGMVSCGLVGFVLLIQKILIVAAIIVVAIGALHFYSGDGVVGRSQESSSKTKYISIVNAYVTRGTDLCVEIENQDGSKKTFKTTYGGGIVLTGYTNNSVTLEVVGSLARTHSKNIVVKRLKGNTLFSAELVEESNSIVAR